MFAVRVADQAKPPQISEKTQGKMGCGDQSATGPVFPTHRLSVADRTPDPDCKEHSRANRRK
jgi:hypothetical protein